MSRPKSILKEELSDVELLIAKELHKTCWISGCQPVFHRDEVRNILARLEMEGYKIIQKETKE